MVAVTALATATSGQAEGATKEAEAVEEGEDEAGEEGMKRDKSLLTVSSVMSTESGDWDAGKERNEGNGMRLTPDGLGTIGIGSNSISRDGPFEERIRAPTSTLVGWKTQGKEDEEEEEEDG